ncbi:MAG: prolyl oligopeptidase family serine peptidase [Phycisphaerales bacterium]
MPVLPSVLLVVPFMLALDGPPATPARPVTETVHGVTITDNYRWLEGDNADPKNMGKMTPEVATWTDAQNAYTRSVLDGLPGRKELEAKLLPLMEVGSVSAPAMKGSRYFYYKREGNQNQPRVFVREGYRGEPRLLLDPAAIDASGLVTVSWISPSHDGKLMAYGTYRAGDENSTLHLMDVDTGKAMPLEIPGKVGAPDWMPDSSGFLYRNLADIKNPYSGQVKFHKMGTEITADPLIFRQYTKEENEQLATTYGPGGGLSKDGRWLILSYATDTRNNDLWAADFGAYLKTGKLVKADIVVGEQAASGGEVIGDTMYMQTTLDAPNGRIVAVDLKNPARSGWKVLVPERQDAVIQGASVAKGVLAVQYLANASSTIELYDLAGKSLGALKLPGIGSAGLSTEDDRTEAYLSFTSYNYPSSIFRVDLAKHNADAELWERPAVPVDPSTVEVKQEWYSSKDGTKVSMFIVHKKGLKKDGNAPTILYGYGGFNVSLTPSFSATLFQWFDAGGVYAVPNLRGGGEYGKAWHEAGKLDRKQNVFNDFISAAEHLISSGYTNPSRLGITGGSNGGLLTGAMVTQRPDLFAAVFIGVPLLDMVRFQDFLMARYWVPEYGSAEDKNQFAYIFKYSPYHNIKKGTKYPAVLVTAGENDSRVHPMHARKMAAAMREATASDQSAKPILLWVDREAGHGQGKPLNLRVRDAADQRIFMMWQLGMLKKQ